jgi:hypothetical protein
MLKAYQPAGRTAIDHLAMRPPQRSSTFDLGRRPLRRLPRRHSTIAA